MDFSDLRKVIRRLIIESTRDSNAIGAIKQDMLDSMMPPNSQLSKRDQSMYDLSDSGIVTTSIRRYLKQVWNDRVYGATKNTQGVPGAGEQGDPELKRKQEERERFWLYSPKLKIVHWIGLVSDKDGDIASVLNNHLSRRNQSLTKKAELSCIGYYEQEPSVKAVACGLLLKGRPTFAYEGDAYTEHLSSAEQLHKLHHKESGLPKRPSTFFNPNYVLFSEDDVKNMDNSHIGEVILSNYTIDTILINRDANRSVRKKLKTIARKSGLPIKFF